MSAHTNPHSCKSKFWRPWRKISCSFASLGDFGTIQAQAVAKICILRVKSIPLRRVLAKSRTSCFLGRETSKTATAAREESPLGIELPAAGAPYATTLNLSLSVATVQFFRHSGHKKRITFQKITKKRRPGGRPL